MPTSEDADPSASMPLALQSVFYKVAAPAAAAAAAAALCAAAPPARGTMHAVFPRLVIPIPLSPHVNPSGQLKARARLTLPGGCSPLPPPRPGAAAIHGGAGVH